MLQWQYVCEVERHLMGCVTQTLFLTHALRARELFRTEPTQPLVYSHSRSREEEHPQPKIILINIRVWQYVCKAGRHLMGYVTHTLFTHARTGTHTMRAPFTSNEPSVILDELS